MSRLLLIDDDSSIVQILKEILELDGFMVDYAYSGVDALNKANLDNYDLILLDFMMPDLNGIDVLKLIRSKYKTPIIILTALYDTFNRILAIEIGADDYISKPFDDRELVAKIKSVIRKSKKNNDYLAGISGEQLQKLSPNFFSSNSNFIDIPVNATNINYSDLPDHSLVAPIVNQQGNLLSFAGLQLDVGKHRCTFKGEVINFTSTEFRLLEVIFRTPGVVLSREYLCTEVLGKNIKDQERSIDMHMSNIRRKLPKRDDGLEWFKTLRSRGYLLVSE